jgi:Secretion system C-terminal sorting domain
MEIKLMVFNPDGEVNYHKSFKTGILSSNKCDIAFDNLGNLIFGVTFVDSLVSTDVNIPNAGLEDFAVISFTSSGVLNNILTESTPSNECLKYVFNDNFDCFIAGEVEGDLRQRTLGSQNFYFADTTNNSLSFIAYLNTNSIQSKATSSNGKSLDSEFKNRNLTNQTINSISVFPNPTTGELNLKFNSQNLETGSTKISILNAVGKVVWMQEFEQNQTGNKLIETSASWPAGVYFLQVDAPNANKQIIKIIKL